MRFAKLRPGNFDRGLAAADIPKDVVSAVFLVPIGFETRRNFLAFYH